MTVSKRLRFEILRRDNYTCRYCHDDQSNQTKRARLTVDHVVPVALGGTDEPTNIVACCSDCNAGKSATSLDSATVADVGEDALRQAKQIEQAYAVLVERMGEREEYIDEWAESYTYTPLPADWRNTIGRWFEMGVPLELIVDAADIACNKAQRFNGDGRFSYMCGIVWKQVHAVRELVTTREALQGSFLTAEREGMLQEHWWREGYDIAHRRMARAVTPLSAVVDGMLGRLPAEMRWVS